MKARNLYGLVLAICVVHVLFTLVDFLPLDFLHRILLVRVGADKNNWSYSIEMKEQLKGLFRLLTISTLVCFYNCENLTAGKTIKLIQHYGTNACHTSFFK